MNLLSVDLSSVVGGYKIEQGITIERSTMSELVLSIWKFFYGAVEQFGFWDPIWQKSLCLITDLEILKPRSS